MPCPTPEKNRFYSEADAHFSVQRNLNDLPVVSAIYPYACECGFYHLTSMVPAEQLAEGFDLH